MLEPSRQGRRNLGAVVAALAVCAVGIGVSWIWNQPAPTALHFARRPVPAPAEIPSAPRQAAVPSSPLPRDSSDLDALFDIFRESGDSPAVKEFVQEFAAEPVLQKAYEEFKADQESPEPRQTLESFSRRLSEKVEFRALVSRFSQDPGFREAALKLTQEPRVSAIVKSMIAAARGSRTAAGSARAALTRGRGPGSGSMPQGFAGRPQAGAPVARAGGVGPQTEFGPAGAGVRPGGQLAQAGAATASEVSGAGPGPGNGATGTKNNSMNAPSTDAHDVDTDLGGIDPKPKSEDMDQALRDWLAQNGLDADAILGDKNSGIWDYCFKKNLLKNCDAACNSAPLKISTQLKQYCGLPSGGYPYWSACMQAYNDELTCIAECQKQEPCVVDPEKLEKWCVIKPAPLPSCTQAKVKSYRDALPPAACGEKKRVVCKDSSGNTVTVPATNCLAGGADLKFAKKRHSEVNKMQSCSGWKPTWITGKDECESWRKTSQSPGFRDHLFNQSLKEIQRCGKCDCPGK